MPHICHPASPVLVFSLLLFLFTDFPASFPTQTPWDPSSPFRGSPLSASGASPLTFRTCGSLPVAGPGVAESSDPSPQLEEGIGVLGVGCEHLPAEPPRHKPPRRDSFIRLIIYPLKNPTLTTYYVPAPAGGGGDTESLSSKSSGSGGEGAKPHGTRHNVTACRTLQGPKGAHDSLARSSGKIPEEVVQGSLGGEKWGMHSPGEGTCTAPGISRCSRGGGRVPVQTPPVCPPDSSTQQGLVV